MTSFLQPGHVLVDRYEIAGEIGRGGFSVVYDALDRELGQRVAVKLLVPPPAVAEKARERMRREVMAVRSLRSAHIVRVFDFLEEGPWSFVVMEQVPGGDLHARISRNGPLEPDEARRLGEELAGALAAAHRHGILHRDVKPHNILLDDQRRALLTDFGSAKIEGQSTLTVTGHQVGTPDTMAPEVMRGARADGRSDVYSLGLTLYFALTGRFPPSEFAHGPAPPESGGYRPSALRSELPEDLDAAVARATCADPADRFPTAARFADVLAGRERALPVDAEHRTPSLDLCLLCGGPDALGLSVCAGCQSDGKARDTCILVDPRVASAGRVQLQERLSSLAGHADASVREAVRGDRSLLAVSATAAPRLTEQLTARGIPVRAVPRARVWRALPGSLQRLLLANIVVATALGLLLDVTFAVSAAFVVPALTWGSTRRLRRPLLLPSASGPRLPEAVEQQAARTLAELGAGAARSLLVDVVRTGQRLFAHADGPGSPLGARVGELVSAACDAALQLGGIDDALERLDKQRAQHSQLPSGWLRGLAQCESARDALVQRLLEALAALGAVRSDELGCDGALDPIAELAAELEAERRLQAEATRELESFLEGS